jgi:hypothetical protein
MPEDCRKVDGPVAKADGAAKEAKVPDLISPAEQAWSVPLGFHLIF